MDRRSFLELTTGAALGAALLPALSACEITEVISAPVGDGGPANRLDFDVARAPYQPLANVAGIVALDAGSKRLLLIRVSSGEIVALDRICTHQGCDMDPTRSGTWDAANLEIVCRCHRAIFNAHGGVVSGPAPRPLKSYAVTFDAGTGKGSVSLA
jgi:Rieske Fe-S protein